MRSRLHAERGGDAGFSLIELLVVIVILGVLAAVAIPLFLTQRSKAHDSSTKADVSALGKEIATYFVDGHGVLTLDFGSTPGSVLLSDGTYNARVKLTNGTARSGVGGTANLGDQQHWCVALTDPQGQEKDYKYSAESGLAPGTC